MSDHPSIAWWGDVLRGYTALREVRPADKVVPVPLEHVLGLRDALVDVLCGQALADHLGDVRNEERTLWSLLGVDHQRVTDAFSGPYDTDFQITRALLAMAGLRLPEHLRDGKDS